ncbi:hypothetical protein E2562_023749 [Oryza meyeriana var. granulata]|uniref:Acidic protein n=1 Tax=Oryza meyeriana var. granulata TaxID=110450 RepID=A0A6G1DLE2_9ORYZ|nr:hypothetical protein E2562_023749 [Oryza meyeriana var. granulata]
MGIASRRAAAALLLLVVSVVVATGGAEDGEKGSGAEQLGCFCDCMKNRCMTLGTGPNKFDCAAACTEGCMQIGQPGQPKDDDFCGF